MIFVIAGFLPTRIVLGFQYKTKKPLLIMSGFTVYKSIRVKLLGKFIL